MLIMTGSDRDKLLRLVNGGAAPFQGSEVLNMPLLDEDFIEFAAKIIEAARPNSKPLDRAVLFDAFKSFGNRPQFFMSAVGRILNPLAQPSGKGFELDMLNAALAKQASHEKELRATYLSLKPLERAVVWRMLASGEKFRPYDNESLEFYRQAVGNPKIGQSGVQAALESLRALDPPVVWKSYRGVYAIEATSMERWYLSLDEAGAWPPA